jgi:hypothetical protein
VAPRFSVRPEANAANEGAPALRWYVRPHGTVFHMPWAYSLRTGRSAAYVL